MAAYAIVNASRGADVRMVASKAVTDHRLPSMSADHTVTVAGGAWAKLLDVPGQSLKPPPVIPPIITGLEYVPLPQRLAPPAMVYVIWQLLTFAPVVPVVPVQSVPMLLPSPTKHPLQSQSLITNVQVLAPSKSISA
jgi:hypothetical protein